MFLFIYVILVVEAVADLATLGLVVPAVALGGGGGGGGGCGGGGTLGAPIKHNAISCFF